MIVVCVAENYVIGPKSKYIHICVEPATGDWRLTSLAMYSGLPTKRCYHFNIVAKPRMVNQWRLVTHSVTFFSLFRLF